MATQLASKIRASFNVSFSPLLVSKYNTVYEQAEYILTQFFPPIDEAAIETQIHISKIISKTISQELLWNKVNINTIKNLTENPQFINDLTTEFKVVVNKENILACNTKEEVSEYIDTLLWASKNSTIKDDTEMLEFEL